jgi:C1A family cysteine protease
MARHLAFLLVCALLVVLAVADPAPFVASKVYSTEYVIDLPYGKISEPVRVYYDGPNNRARFSYYGMLDDYLFRYDENVTYYIGPQNTKMVCTPVRGAGSIATVFPDLTKFSYMGTSDIDGEEVDHFQWINLQLGRNNTYDWYQAIGDGRPLMFTMLGYDYLFGSHYDQYIVQYHRYETELPTHAFTPPRLCDAAAPFDGEKAAFDVQKPLRLHNFLEPTAEKWSMAKVFDGFIHRYSKNYAAAEFEERFNTFVANAEKLSELLRAKGERTFEMGLNHFADMSDEEFRSSVLMQKDTLAAMLQKYGLPTLSAAVESEKVQVPTSVDWRQKGAVSKIKDQAICGSCWTFAATGCMESAYFIKYGKMYDLSEEQIMNCAWNYSVAGCGGGFAHAAFQYVHDIGGIEENKDYPYLGADAFCKFDSSKTVVSVDSWAYVPTGNANAMKATLAKQPVAIAIDASHTSFKYYHSGVYYEPNCASDPNGLDHAVLAVGYGTDAVAGDYWIVKNSWSTHWGDGGFVKMSAKNNNCGVLTMPSYAEVSEPSH